MFQHEGHMKPAGERGRCSTQKIVQIVEDSNALGAPVTNHREGDFIFRHVNVIKCIGVVDDAAVSTLSADLNVNPSEADKRC